MRRKKRVERAGRGDAGGGELPRSHSLAGPSLPLQKKQIHPWTRITLELTPFGACSA